MRDVLREGVGDLEAVGLFNLGPRCRAGAVFGKGIDSAPVPIRDSVRVRTRLLFRL